MAAGAMAVGATAVEMGISDGSTPGALDGAAGAAGYFGPVGAIVWVRRRNGSWWPGRILSAEELPASQLMPPKSGAPVKLLGREDASVEWYNLEKSIRVKPFRCGEFDACIERAEASQGIPIKRREKYARREDAILHALELERKLLQKHQKRGTTPDDISNRTPDAVKIELSGCSLEDYTRNAEIVGCSKFSDDKSQVRRVLSSLEEDNYGDSLYVDKGRYGKPISREDVPVSSPRTRGLQDFGLRIAPAKKKHFQFVAWDSLQKPVDNHVGDLSCAGQGMGGHRYPGSGKISMGVKRKTSHAGMLEESPAKRRDRRRPLVQVLESSAKLPSFQSFQPDHDTGINPTQGEKDNMGAICRAKRSRCIYLPVDSNDSPDHLGHSFKQTPTVAQTMTGICQRQRNYSADENMSSGFEEESDTWQRGDSETDVEEQENLLTDTKVLVPGPENSVRDARFNFIVPQMHPYEHATDAAAEVGMSKWHMKGKRNIRNLAKGAINTMSGNNVDKCNASTETSYESKKPGFKMRRINPSSRNALRQGFYRKMEFNYVCEEGDFVEDSSHPHATVYGSQRYGSAPKAAKRRASSFIDSDDDSNVIAQAGWEVDGPSHVARRTYWKEPVCTDRTYTDHLTDEMDSRIVDIDLKVRASYQGEHVPLVSLMSKLNGKAIIGHPVQVEVLLDRSTDSLFRDEPKLGDSTAPSPVWKTARRTAIQRIPRSNPVRSVLESEDSDHLQCSDLESNPPIKKAYSGHFSHQARLVKKSMSHIHRSASGKFQRKPLKSVSLSGKKTRTLSSLSTDNKHSGEHGDAKLARDGDILGGLTKPEAAVPLVPLKVVFSRILEAIGRTASHRVLVTSSTARDPL